MVYVAQESFVQVVDGRELLLLHRNRALALLPGLENNFKI
jgi:hypothetical protein